MTSKQFKKGDVIFHEGDIGNTLYQINQGKVDIYLCYGESDQKLLTELSAGKFFGEMAVIEAYPRSATAVAMDDTDVTEIASTEVADYFRAKPDMIIEIMNGIGKRLRDLTEQYDEISDTIRQLGDSDDEEKNEGLIASIRKFADAYKKNKAAEKLSAETLRKLEQKGHSEGYKVKVETYKKGTIIFRDGEDGDCMYDIHFGSIGVYKDYGLSTEKMLTKLSANEFLGELALIGKVERSATAVALEDDTTVEIITGSDLKELFAQNPPKVEMILEHLSYRLRKLTKEYFAGCKILYRVSEAGYKYNEIGPDLQNDINDYIGRLYD